MQVEPSSVARAIHSFPCGSAGGPDRLRPHHFGGSGEAGGSNCCGLHTIRRLVAKIAGQLVVDEMAELLSPRQLGYGASWGF